MPTDTDKKTVATISTEDGPRLQKEHTKTVVVFFVHASENTSIGSLYAEYTKSDVNPDMWPFTDWVADKAKSYEDKFNATQIIPKSFNIDEDDLATLCDPGVPSRMPDAGIFAAGLGITHRKALSNFRKRTKGMSTGQIVDLLA